ncbi:MAG: sigma 54-interacting transcriptional regulator [Pseudomonadota bacterium]
MTVDDIPRDLLAALLDNPHESLILIDDQAVVRRLSPAAAEFYGVDPEAAVGRSVLELNPDSSLPQVLKTGKAEVGQVWLMKGRERIIARIPLRSPDGKIVGAAGKLMFWHVDRMRELARQTEVLKEQLQFYEKELQSLYSSRFDLEQVVGESPLLRDAKKKAVLAAESDLSVLVTGETGTGKGLFARAIHRLSSRGKKPFVQVNCGAIPSELFESELFGYEPGAFTGAGKKGKPGRFELADGGIIFLDEVGDLPLPLQVKLLRVIQEGEVERLGGGKPLTLDFRIIAATNRDLRTMMLQGGFRPDLFYRLNIFQLEIPPLRKIREDIPRLAYHILANHRSAGRPGPTRISREAMALLQAHDWPGNIRELKNAVIRAAAMAGGQDIVAPEHLPPDIPDRPEDGAGPDPTAGPPTPPRTLRRELALAEKRAIEKALAAANGRRGEAAALLGIHRTGLFQKMRKYGLL